MRIIIAAVSVFALAVAASAFAQTKAPDAALSVRGPATQAFVQFCVASPHMAASTVPEPSCACAAGVMSGQMTDRQYIIMGRLTPYTGNEAGMRDEILRMVGEGYTGDEIVVVGNMMVASEALINSTCAVLER
jgi:hypothetical protein